MKTFNYTFSAGENKTFAGGKFFIVITAGDAINITYLKNFTQVDETAQGITSGYYFESDEGFDTVQVYSATAQTVKAGVSKSGSGGFNISSQIITGGTLDGITPITLGTSFEFLSNSTTTLFTVVAPSSNINGVRVNTAQVNVYLGGGYIARFMAKTSAPTARNDSSADTICMASSGAAGEGSQMVRMETPIIIPAGKGLYFWTNDNSSGADNYCNYEVL